jgi:hypothetical protein
MGGLRQEVKEQLVKYLDEKYEFMFLLEMVDNKLFNFIIELLDRKVFSKVPERYTEDLNEAFIKMVEEKYNEVGNILDDVLSGSIKTPLVDGTEKEKQLYNTLIVTLLGLLDRSYTENQ